jgi:PAS domain S-box-containing protein
MTQTLPVRRRVARACVTIVALGLALTTSSYVITRDVVTRLNHQRIDRPANAALLVVQQLSSAVDQVLATAGGVVAASGGDPKRFVTVLAPDVTSSSSLAGIALVDPHRGSGGGVTSVGDTTLLKGKAPAALAIDGGATLIAHRRGRTSFELGFASRLASGTAIFLQITLPATSDVGASFALVAGSGTRATEIVLGNVASISGLTRWSGAVVLGGQQFTMLIAADRATNALAGTQLPLVTLFVGLLLTLVAALVARTVVRRNYAVGLLETENRALDLAIEQQRRVEAELRASQARVQAMLRDSPDAIALLDVDDGACEVLNRAAFLGRPIDELSEPGGLLRLVHPDDRGDAEAQFDRLRQLDDDQILETTLRMTAADGRDRFVRLRFSPLRTTEDAPGTLLGSLSDVTEEWENQLREAELQEALRRSQRLESVGRLAGGVAHDFNNILAAIQASAELLESEVPSGRPEEYRQEIERAAQRGAALTRQLLTFAHRDSTEPRSVDLAEVVLGIETLLRRTLSEDVQLQLTTPEESCDVFADPTHLEQVILNLALNARDAMPEGGVLWIAVRTDTDDTSDERVLLSVTDTGTGIDPDVRDRMFDPFVTTKDPGKGTGLGLATVRTIAESVGAQINVCSRPGQGTTFEISFPRGAAAGAAGSTEAFDDDIDGSGLRLLLVEDEGAVRAALAHMLERRRFDVTPVATAMDAMQAIERASFDLVLTDLVMPGMSGRALIERLEATRPETRIVAMSGYSRSDDDSSIPSTITLLRKPFTNTQMFSALRGAMRSTPVAEPTS